MKIKFICFYPASKGKNIFLSLQDNKKGNSYDSLSLSYINNNLWETEIELNNNEIKEVRYRYYSREISSGNIFYDETGIRFFKINHKRFLNYQIKDYFMDNSNEKRLWNSSIFTGILFNRDRSMDNRFRLPTAGKHIIDFHINFVPVDKHHTIGISGNIPELGCWQSDKAIPLNGHLYPDWRMAIRMKHPQQLIEYKYVIINNNTGNISYWEKGDNRVVQLNSAKDTCHCIIKDENINFNGYIFRGAGVSIPVFSLKTKNSFGIGDFTDLKLFADWAAKTRLKLIQILPVNDTTANYTFLDSYPYNTISVFALNPVYLNIFKMGKLKSKKNRIKYEQLQSELNKNYHVDYPTILKYKLEYAFQIFKEQEHNIMKDKNFSSFIRKNKKWLQPYAAFCYLRDKNGTSNFERWNEYSQYSRIKILKLTNEKSDVYPDILFWYFIQYHLDMQLKDACNYARNKGIAVKGDVPIGVGRYSADTWSFPALFNFNGQAGAPPDQFAVDGQNWGFPTYNWEEMSKDNYGWWQDRLRKMADYFDAYRIDHILGFFRIWEIPISAIQGILGHFRPALPFTREELQSSGIWVDTQRYCKPYIREHYLTDIFNGYTDKVRKLYLNEIELKVYELKEEYSTQQKIYNHFMKNGELENLSKEDTFIMSGLLKLAAETILLPDNDKLEAFHPRVSMQSTFSFMELDSDQKNSFNDIYIDYFYQRHEELWRNEALKKLPALINATKMLVCGEDLGMIPAVVPEVMEELNILSLEVQRMPKNEDVEFANPKDAPYLSVCTTSTHDTSTIRGWWEENRALSQRFYNYQLGHHDEMPYYAEPWICQEIINQHLNSPAMWAIFPLQDLLAMSGGLRSNDTCNEQINFPANPRHYWKYRLHLFIEELIDANDFNRTISLMVKNSGRW